MDRRIKRLAGSEIAALREELEQTRQQLNDLRVGNYAVELLLGRTGRGSHRMPTKGQMKTLTDEVREVTDVATAERQVHQAYRTLVVLEALGAGRVAGGTMNVVGKLSTITLLKPPNDEVLEIGTLHGLFAAALARQLISDGRTPSLTIVDPLADVQLQPGHVVAADPSGTPVAEQVVRANLTLSGLAQDRLRLRRGFSDAPEVRSTVSDRQYGVIIVDGDHSEEGVRQDLEWAETIAASGGIVVLDDYTDRNWPGVAAAAEKHLAGDTRFTYIGRTATTGFLRVR
ncbi:class I SAM-dependent methyltransferase [Streptomyces gobiensis]|uniref:class I SAM-dependent methyltransferase n=1 Tax=Streptomyces gobiensis TaxID=2875706 RepID=UPI001E3ADE26|nr:class I SAM-dependent methyltransferase [Streptomyces gobiensis]UGY94598.1 class I SAM-dependent methyltransferase [Streptomyces gobiensis]